jgi:cytoskeleton protein RodZ
MDEAAPGNLAGVGARLQQARERLGFTRTQAAEKLHLEARTIEALETENFAALGASVYIRGHLRRYADLLGESAAQIDAQYCQRPHATSAPDLSSVPRQLLGGGNARAPKLGPWPAGLAAAALAVAVLIWWALHSTPRNTPAASTAVTETIKIDPSPALTDTTAPASTPAPAPVAAAAPPAANEHPAAPTAVPARDKNPLALAAATPAAGAVPVQLSLRFSGQSWAEVYAADGARLWAEVGQRGSSQDLQGLAPLHVVLGDPAAVAINLNGRGVSLPWRLRHTANVSFTVDASGHVAGP